MPVAGSYLQRFGAGLIAAIAYVFAVLRTIAGIIGDYLGPALAPLGRMLRQPTIRLPLLIAGAVALAGGIIRAYANGFERDTWIALLIGIGLLGALALAHAGGGVPAWLSSPVAAASGRLSGGARGVAGRPLVQGTFAVVVLALLAAGAVMAWRSAVGRFGRHRQPVASGAARSRARRSACRPPTAATWKDAAPPSRVTRCASARRPYA